MEALGIAEGARAAEKAGYDSVWVGEAYNRGWLLADPFVAMGIAAAVTERLEVGAHVVIAPVRPAFMLASQAASVASVAPGRFVLGLGAGSNPADFKAMGLDFASRFRVLDQHIDTIRRLLAGEDVDGARLANDVSVPPIPIMLGTAGHGRWNRKAALELDGWMASSYAEDVPTILEGIKRFRDIAGDKRAIVTNVFADRPDAADVLAAMAEAGFDDATVRFDSYDPESLDRARALVPR